jgi:predicted MFS family arabinose efflux permease
VSGIKYYISNISMAFVFIIGAYLFTINPKLPAILSLIPIITGFILIFFMTEPYRNRKKVNFVNSWKHLKEGLRLFWNNNYLKYLAMFTFIILSAVSVMLSFSSAYFQEIRIPVYLMGAVAFVASLITAFSSKRTHKLEEKIGEKKSLFIVQIALIFSIVLMSLMIPYIGVLFYLLIPFVNGFFNVLVSDYANRNIDTQHRATMLSINNMFGNIGNTFIFPVIGWGIKSYSMGRTFFVFGIFIMAFLFIVYFYRKREVD